LIFNLQVFIQKGHAESRGSVIASAVLAFCVKQKNTKMAKKTRNIGKLNSGR